MGVRPLFGGFLPEHFSGTPPAGVPRPAIIAFERCAEEGGGLTVTVVGVVELAQLGSQWRENFGQIYVPIRLITTPPRSVFLVQTDGHPQAVSRAVGLIASWWTTRLVKSYVYRYDAHDPRVWAVATAVLIGAAVLAAWIPARRASRVNPTVALRAA